MESKEEREAFARKVINDLGAAVKREVSPGLGFISKAWDLTADADQRFTYALSQYVNGRTTKGQLIAEGKRILSLWQKVNEAYLRVVNERVTDEGQLDGFSNGEATNDEAGHMGSASGGA